MLVAQLRPAFESKEFNPVSFKIKSGQVFPMINYSADVVELIAVGCDEQGRGRVAEEYLRDLQTQDSARYIRDRFASIWDLALVNEDYLMKDHGDITVAYSDIKARLFVMAAVHLPEHSWQQ